VPHAGGDYLYLSRAFGPVWGFLAGWAGFRLTLSAASATATPDDASRKSVTVVVRQKAHELKGHVTLIK
jgi:hypothetical protein